MSTTPSNALHHEGIRSRPPGDQLSTQVGGDDAAITTTASFTSSAAAETE